MKKEVPENFSQNEVNFKVEEIEPLLSGYPIDLPKWEPMYITLLNGRTMVIRELKKGKSSTFLSSS